MNPTLQPLAQMLETNSSWYLKAFDGLEAETSQRQLSPETNNLVWLFGHLATMRFHMAECLGLKEKAPWGDIFWKSIVELDRSKCPTPGEFRTVWNDITRSIMTKIPEVTEPELQAPPPDPFPKEGTSLSILTFLVQHESYHMGQIGYIRRLLNLEAL